jgi:hypothetical protein
MKKSQRLAILAFAIMATLTVSLVLASGTMNPRITYTGYGEPDPSTGREGDLYVDLDTSILWVYREENEAWNMFAIFPEVVNGTEGPVGPEGPPGPQGEPGPAGADGADGIDGIDGRRGSLAFYEGIHEPEDTTVLFEGDSYHYLNGDVYVYNGTDWVYFTNLVGPQGEQGIQGIQGETGATGPAGPQGEQGIQGIQGETGATGPAGVEGIDGVDGKSILSGIGKPNATFGQVGDAYLDVTTGDVYEYFFERVSAVETVQGWNLVGNLKGADGIDGVDGIDGSAGTPAVAGDLGIPWWIIGVLAAVSSLAVAFSVYAVREHNENGTKK